MLSEQDAKEDLQNLCGSTSVLLTSGEVKECAGFIGGLHKQIEG